MLIHFGLESLRIEWSRSLVCIGTFDGIHLGHQALIRESVRQSQWREAPAVIVSFDRHPLSVLAPNKAPLAIATLSQNVRRIRSMGISAMLVLPFTSELADTTAGDFFDHVLIEKLHAEHIVIGEDFCFGKNREGCAEWLEGRISVSRVPPVLHQGVRISSTTIRTLLSEGSVERAIEYLGRPYELEGVVVTGQKLGRTLGYPTVNLARMEGTILPADGIYAGLAHTPIGGYRAAISVGKRPAVGGQERTVEAYLLDYPGESLYGCPIGLEFWARLRNELNFEGLDELKAQIGKDVEIARTVERPRSVERTAETL